MTELPKWATELKWDGFDVLPLGEIPNHEFVRAIYRAACVEIQKLRGKLAAQVARRPAEVECIRGGPASSQLSPCNWPHCICSQPKEFALRSKGRLTTRLPRR